MYVYRHLSIIYQTVGMQTTGGVIVTLNGSVGVRECSAFSHASFSMPGI